MSIFIDSLLDKHTLIALRDSLSNQNLFIDGKISAGGAAKKVKENLQAETCSNQVIAGQTLIEKSLFTHPAVKKAIYPGRLAKVVFSRYEEGMFYGDHVDEGVINNVRTDIAFTLFLSDPDSYNGGELEIRKSDGYDSIKLPEGGLYLYAADSIHQVKPVTSGIRLAAVGWIQSKIRSPQHRQILADLNNSLQLLPLNEQNKYARLDLLKAKNNLERLWIE